MAMQALTMEVPDELIALLGTPEVVADRAKEALILELLRQGEISQGMAARLLGVNRWVLLDLMAKHAIPSGPESPDELSQELAVAQPFLRGR
jgi:predicted HTH domain antitoxin